MANLILTGKCVRNCSYCFAKESDVGEFTLENFMKAVAFIKTGPPMVNLLGGEPTEHPLFTTFLEHVLNEQCVTRVFTNGMLFSDRLNNISNTIARMKDKHQDKIDLLFNVNINNPSIRTERENLLQRKFFDNFNDITYIGHTIYDENEDLNYLIDTIIDHGLDPAIRLGLALPILGVSNNYLERENYEKAATNILELLNKAKELNIEVHFDCGFPLCMFSFEEIIEIMKNSKKGNLAYVCGQALDIFPNLKVANCFPLSKLYKTSITEYENIMELYAHMEDEFMTPEGSYTDKCRNCFYFGYACSGGCKAFYMMDLRERRLQQNAAD